MDTFSTRRARQQARTLRLPQAGGGSQDEGDSLQQALQHHCFDHRPFEFVERCRYHLRSAIVSASPLLSPPAPKVPAKFASALAPRWARHDTCFLPAEIRIRASVRCHAHIRYWRDQLANAAVWRSRHLATVVPYGRAHLVLSCPSGPASASTQAL